MRLLFVFLFICIILGCNNKENNNGNALTELKTRNTVIPPKDNSKQEAIQDTTVPGNLSKEVNLKLQVSNIIKTTDQLHILAKKYHGNMSSEVQSKQDNRKEISTVIRVPVRSIDSIINEILLLAIKVDTRTLNTLDLTEDNININARLKTKRELEKTYQNLLKQTHNVSEVMSIEKELSTVRGDIESMEARLKYLNTQIRFASIALSCYEISYPNSSLWKDISLITTGLWIALVKFVILLFRAWPLLILMFILLYFRKRKYRNKK